MLIKEQRSEMVKHHLWVLWTDYFKAPHFEKYPNLHTLFNEATKLAGTGGTKGSMDAAAADQLLAAVPVHALTVVAFIGAITDFFVNLRGCDSRPCSNTA